MSSDDICPVGCLKIKLLGLWGGNDSPYQKSNRCGGRPGVFTTLPSSPESQCLGWRAFSGDTPVVISWIFTAKGSCGSRRFLVLISEMGELGSPPYVSESLVD